MPLGKVNGNDLALGDQTSPEPGFVPGRYAPEVILPVTLDPLALLQRWKQHTQGRVTARLLGESLRRRRLARVARVVFDGWRTGMGPRQRREAQAMAAALSAAATATAAAAAAAAAAATAAAGAAESAAAVNCAHQTKDSDTLAAEQEDNVAVTPVVTGTGTVASDDDNVEEPQAMRSLRQGLERRQTFAERRAEVDLRIARRTVIAGWRGALTREIGLRQAKQEWRLKKAARREPT